jgi:hypothetical protein
MPRESLTEVQRTFRVPDARGRRAAMLDPYALYLFRRHDIIPAEPLATLAREIGTGLSPKLRRLVIVLGVVAGLSAVIFAIFCVDMLIHRQLTRIFEKAPLFTLQLWFWPLIIWLNAKRVRYKRIQAVMLKHLRCPHCGYDLRGLPTAPEDGATICPECGYAWRLPHEPATI